jgi:lipopolysaccharide export system permease protein
LVALGAMMVLVRYLAKEITLATLFVLLAFLGLFAFFDLIHELGDLGRGTYRATQAVQFVLLSVPGHVYELLPVAALVGTIYALVSLASTSEFTIMRVSGLSTAKLFLLVLLLGLPFVVLTYLFGEMIAPPLDQRAQRMKMVATQSAAKKDLKTGFWVKSNRSFINVRNMFGDGRLQGVRIYDFDANAKLQAISFAETGEFKPPGQWVLKGVTRTTFQELSAKVETLPELRWQADLSPEVMNVLMVSPDKMSAQALKTYIDHLQENKQKTQRFDVAFWKKLMYPFAIFVMMALALPFAYLNARAGGIAWKVFAGVMLGMGFHLLNGLFSSLGVLNTWPPYAATLVPFALFLTLAMGMLWWTERR